MNFLRSILIFLITGIAFIGIAGIFLALFTKEEIHLFVNQHYTDITDVLFTYWTYLGDGLATAIIALAIAAWKFKDYGYSTLILGALTLVLAGLFAQFMKQVIYPDALRPLSYFGENVLRLVPGEKVHYSHSFPSGHTTSAFAFFSFLAFTVAPYRYKLQVLLAIAAGLVAYSRMYLSQHFLEDVFVGSILGMLAFITAALITRSLKLKKNIISINSTSLRKSST